MRRRDSLNTRLAQAWIQHEASFWAWEEVQDMAVPLRWRMVQAMVASAPDFATLCYIAAGPVEDLLLSERMQKLMHQEAEVKRRFRLCLRGAYGLPQELQRLADMEPEVEPLPPPNAMELTAREAEVMVGYFRNHDTFWASELLEEWIEQDPEAAWPTVELLIKISNDNPHVRELVLHGALKPFLQRHFSTYQGHLKEIVSCNVGLRRWLSDLKEAPINDSDWTSFLKDLTRG
jgi:hypothetical protein